MSKNSSITRPSAPIEPQEERLQSVLARRGVASRRRAAELITAGLVTVNGSVVVQPGARVVVGHDAIALEGQPIAETEERKRTIVLYKPRGIISSADSQDGQTVCDLLRPHFSERLVPVGRLDKESEGLLLMSNDGALTHRLTHPRYGFTKSYTARVAGKMADAKIATLRSPLMIDGYRIRPVEVEVIKVGRDNVHTLSFTLGEGRNRQIRKMCAQAHFVVLSLKRIRLGTITLGDLHPGQWRELSAAEVRGLMEAGQ